MKILNELNTSGNNPLGIDSGNILNILQFCLFYSIKIFTKLKLTEPLEVNVIYNLSILINLINFRHLKKLSFCIL